MRDLNLNGTKCTLLTTTKDVSGERWNEINLWRAMALAGVDAEDLMHNLSGMLQAFDMSRAAQFVIYLDRARTGLENLQNKRNPQHFLFALVVMLPGEDPWDPATVQYDRLAAKVQTFYELKVPQDVYEKVTENFIQTCRKN